MEIKKYDIDRHAGQTLRTIRHKNNLSQVELGGVLGVSAQQIHKLEAGKNALSLYQLALLRVQFGVRVEDFLDKNIVKSISYVEIRLDVAGLKSAAEAEKILSEAHNYAYKIRHLLQGVTFGGM